MRVGLFALGILLVLIGFNLYSYSTNALSEYQSIWGQVGRELSEPVRQRYQTLLMYQSLGGVLTITGILISIAGIVMKREMKIEKREERAVSPMDEIKQLEKLEERLLEGKISEETYRRIKERLEEMAKLPERRKTFKINPGKIVRIGFLLSPESPIFGEIKVKGGDVYFSIRDDKNRIVMGEEKVKHKTFKFTPLVKGTYYITFDNLHSLLSGKTVLFTYRTKGIEL